MIMRILAGMDRDRNQAAVIGRCWNGVRTDALILSMFHNSETDVGTNWGISALICSSLSVIFVHIPR
jgi:hypothetical protein